jgi:PPIC-type PPIASE domain
LPRLLSEPLVHFFAIGALLFLAHHWIAGDPRTIVVTPGLKAELSRRFEDQNGRKPDAAELAKALHDWERDEALFREAVKDHLDRDDTGVRSALIDKMHARAAFEVPKREPTEAEIEAWFASHPNLYAAPLRYDFEFLAFPKTDPGAREQRDKFQHAIEGGANATTLGRPVIGGDLTVADMTNRIEPELALRIPSLQPGAWQPLETSQSFYFARVKHVEGGVPSLEQVRPHVIADWLLATKQAAVDRILQGTIDRYRIEQSP